MPTVSATIIRVDISVCFIEGMAPNTVGFASVLSGTPITAKDVRTGSHGLHVTWIRARPITAKMVYLKTLWNRGN